jgi:streptomycin 6-kinase
LTGLTPDGPPLSESYNLLLPMRRGADRFVLKIHAERDEYRYEAAALRAWSGVPAAVRVIEDDGHSLLLERADGVSLESTWDATRDDADTYALAGVMRELRVPCPDAGLPHVRDWLAALRVPRPGLPTDHARAMADDLLASTDADVLLHGDLHHGNVLRDASGRLTVIDPKGVLGDPAFEVGAMLRNPMTRFLDAPDPAALIQRRLDICADVLGTDRDRLRAWGYVVQVLCAVWAGDDADMAGYCLRCAELISRS